MKSLIILAIYMLLTPAFAGYQCKTVASAVKAPGNFGKLRRKCRAIFDRSGYYNSWKVLPTTVYRNGRAQPGYVCRVCWGGGDH